MSVDSIALLDKTRKSLGFTSLKLYLAFLSLVANEPFVQSQKSEMTMLSVCYEIDGSVLDSAAHYKNDRQHYFTYYICY